MILIQVHHKVAAAYTAAMTTAKPTPAADKTATIVVSHATSRSSSHNGPIRASQHLTNVFSISTLYRPCRFHSHDWTTDFEDADRPWRAGHR
jgi:hypothetical protein